MLKVVAVGQYDGELKNSKGETIKYSKVMLTVSENGNYPKLVAIDIPVYQEAGGKLLGKNIEIEYKYLYGKMKASRITVLN